MPKTPLDDAAAMGCANCRRQMLRQQIDVCEIRDFLVIHTGKRPHVETRIWPGQGIINLTGKPFKPSFFKHRIMD